MLYTEPLLRARHCAQRCSLREGVREKRRRQGTSAPVSRARVLKPSARVRTVRVAEHTHAGLSESKAYAPGPWCAGILTTCDPTIHLETPANLGDTAVSEAGQSLQPGGPLISDLHPPCSPPTSGNHVIFPSHLPVCKRRQ